MILERDIKHMHRRLTDQPTAIYTTNAGGFQGLAWTRPSYLLIHQYNCAGYFTRAVSYEDFKDAITASAIELWNALKRDPYQRS